MGPDSPPSGPAETPSTGLTAEQAVERGLEEIHGNAVGASWLIKALAESGYVIVPRPDGDAEDAVAKAIFGYAYTHGSEIGRLGYLSRARAAISTLTAYREGQDG